MAELELESRQLDRRSGARGWAGKMHGRCPEASINQGSCGPLDAEESSVEEINNISYNILILWGFVITNMILYGRHVAQQVRT